MSDQPPPARAVLRERLVSMVVAASDGELAGQDLLGGAGSLRAIGVTSLTYLRLIHAIETEFGVEVDLAGDLSFLDTLEELASHVAALGVRIDDEGSLERR